MKLPRLRRNRSATSAETAAEGEQPVGDGEPCIPCAQQRAVRQFILDPAVISIQDGDVVRAADGVEEEIGDAEVTVVDPTGTTTHVLNATAALIWLSLDGSTSVAGIVHDLSEETGTPVDVIAPDVGPRWLGSSPSAWP